MPELAALGGTPIRNRPFHRWPIYDEREIEALNQVVTSGKWNRWAGDHVRRFEESFAGYMHKSRALAVSSGTAALECALAGIDLKPGDEVILPAYTFTAPVNAVLRFGGVPVFVDIDPETYNLDPGHIEEAITDRTRVILPLHLFGRPADMDALMDIAERHRLSVVEDAALSAGSQWRHRPVGGLGHIGVFSCQAEKNLNCGEGGIVVTDDEKVWERALAYSDYWKGQLLPQPGWDALCSGFRMTEFQAAILLVQLQRLDAQCEIRDANGLYLDREFRTMEGISVPPEDERVTRNSRSLYVFRYHADGWNGIHRNTFVQVLQAEGIPALTGYSRPIYKNPLFVEPERFLPAGHPLVGRKDVWQGYHPSRFPVTERACAEEAVWLRQQTLLCDHEDVIDIVHAVVKAREHMDEVQEVANRT